MICQVHQLLTQKKDIDNYFIEVPRGSGRTGLPDLSANDIMASHLQMKDLVVELKYMHLRIYNLTVYSQDLTPFNPEKLL